MSQPRHTPAAHSPPLAQWPAANAKGGDMGFINDAKANMATAEARKARAAGQRILVYKFIEANTNSKSTAPMTGIAEQIQAVEAEGWQLYNMAAAEGKAMTGERVALVCLFRPTA